MSDKVVDNERKEYDAEEIRNEWLDDKFNEFENKNSKAMMINKSIYNPEKVDFYRDAPYYFDWFFGYYVGHLIDLLNTNKKLDRERLKITKRKLFYLVWNDENIMEVYKEHKKMLIQLYVENEDYKNN